MKKVISIILIFIIMLQVACTNNNVSTTKKHDLSNEQKKLVDEYNNFNIGQKQMLNYITNGMDKHYSYVAFRRPIEIIEYNKVLSYYQKIYGHDIGYTLCTHPVLHEDDRDKKGTWINNCLIPDMNKEGESVTVEFVEYTDEQIKKRDEAYLRTLDKMYSSIEEYKDFSDIQKHYFGFLFNKQYYLKLFYRFMGPYTYKEMNTVYDIVAKYFDFDYFNLGYGDGVKNLDLGYHIFEERKMTEEDYNRTYSYFIDDYKKYYDFLGQTIDKNTENRTYKFEEPAYYDFVEFMVSMYFEQNDTYQLYSYTLDENGMVTSFTWSSIEELIDKAQNHKE